MVNIIRYYKFYFFLLQGKCSRILKQRKLKSYFKNFDNYFADKKGIEIGGPTKIFSEKYLPIYEVSELIDGCNFSNENVWSTNFSKQYTYYKDKKGKQYIAEGSELSEIANETYDFVLSSHNLEHFANPIKALNEWLRILKQGGCIFLILPDKRYTFDRKRETTTFEHIIEDYNNLTKENDTTHLQEILMLHDLSFDPYASSDYKSFKNRCERNYEFRCLHHHVFNQALLTDIFNFLDIEIIAQYSIPMIHQIIVGRKK